MSIAEINEKSSTADVQAYADKIVKEATKDTKSDSQIISEQARQETTAVTTSSEPAEELSDDATLENQSEDSDATESWLTDDVKQELSAYGLKEAEIADFASREELDRALRLFDKSALDAGRKAMAEKETQPRNDKGQFDKKPKTPEPTPEKTGSYEIGLDANEYGEEMVGELTKMRDHYEARLARLDAYEARFEALESQFQQAHELAEEQLFDSLIDALEMPELFGKTGQESETEKQKRDDVFLAMKAQMIGLEQLGRPSAMNQNLMNRVARVVYPEEFSKRELKQRTKKLMTQSNRRQGGGATRPQSPQETDRQYANRLFQELSNK